MPLYGRKVPLLFWLIPRAIYYVKSFYVSEVSVKSVISYAREDMGPIRISAIVV